MLKLRWGRCLRFPGEFAIKEKTHHYSSGYIKQRSSQLSLAADHSAETDLVTFFQIAELPQPGCHEDGCGRPGEAGTRALRSCCGGSDALEAQSPSSGKAK